MKTHKYIHFLLMLLLAGTLMTACSEEDDPVPEDPNTEEPDPEDPDEENPDEENPDEDVDNFYKLIRVENFIADTAGNNPDEANATVFYSLEANTPRKPPMPRPTAGIWPLAIYTTVSCLATTERMAITMDPMPTGSGVSTS